MAPAGITDLPPETLDQIARRVGPLDNVGCSAVCRAWRREIRTTRLRLLRRPNLPHYVCVEPLYERTWWEAQFGVEKEPWTNKVCIRPRYCHRLDGLIGVAMDGNKPSVQPTRVIGSNYGWVVTVDNASNINLLEPLTGRQFILPPLKKAQKSVQQLGQQMFHKTALAPGRRLGTFAILLIHSGGHRLSYLAPGAKCWTELSNPPWNPRQYLDVLLHKGAFYTVSVDSRLNAWAPDKNFIGLRARLVVTPRTDAVWAVLVESTSRDNILLVSTPLNGPGLYLGMAVKVSRLDEREGRWVPEVNSGEVTILAKVNSALCVLRRLEPAFSTNNWYDYVNFSSDSPHDVPETDGSLFLRDGCWFLPYVAPVFPHK